MHSEARAYDAQLLYFRDHPLDKTTSDMHKYWQNKTQEYWRGENSAYRVMNGLLDKYRRKWKWDIDQYQRYLDSIMGP
jgi:hypothetical protein